MNSYNTREEPPEKTLGGRPHRGDTGSSAPRPGTAQLSPGIPIHEDPINPRSTRSYERNPTPDTFRSNLRIRVVQIYAAPRSAKDVATICRGNLHIRTHA